MILGPDGKPMNMTPDLEARLFESSTEGKMFEKKRQLDTEYDKVFVRHLIHRFQAVDPEVGAVFYPHSMSICFWWYGIIVYKVMLTEHNIEDVTIERHMDKFRAALMYLKLNPEFQAKARSLAKNYDKRFGKTL